MTVTDAMAHRRRRNDPPVEYGPVAHGHELAPHRLITCTSCGWLIAVLEASDTSPHDHLDPATFKCGDCHQPKGGKRS